MDLTGKRINISVLFDQVRIEINCGDDYEAQVLYDDLTETVQAGGSFALSVDSGTVAKDSTR
ncbi:MAG TPA: hypothetical protein VMT72_12250 [Pseudolabrys sp.]|nr:hypothetical protein [Pseudolabrys sp.]